MRCILLFWWLLQAVVLWGQVPYGFVFDRQKGLPAKEIFDIHQDDAGYLWVASAQGLFKYNGLRFEPIEHRRRDGAALHEIQSDATGRLWLKDFSPKLWSYSKAGDSLSAFVVDSLPLEELKNFVFAEGKLWFSGYTHFFSYDLETHRVRRFHPAGERVDAPRPHNLSIDSSGGLWAMDYYQGAFVKGQSAQWQSIEIAGKERVVGQKIWYGDTHIETPSTGPLLVNRSENKLYQLVQDTFVPCVSINRRLQADGAELMFVREDRTGQIWLTTYAGAYRIDPKTDQVLQRILPEQAVSDVFQDHTGSYWVGTLRDGLHFFPQLDILYWGGEQAPWANRRFTQIERLDHQHIILADDKGSLLQWNYRTASIKQAYALRYQKAIQRLFVAQSTGTLWASSHNLYQFMPPKADYTWLETYDVRDFTYWQGYLLVAQAFDLLAIPQQQTKAPPFFTKFESGKVLPAFSDSLYSVYHGKNLQAIWADKAVPTRLWLAYEQTLMYWDGDTFHTVFSPSNQRKNLSIHAFAQDTMGRLWMAGEGGVYVWENNAFVQHFPTDDPTQSFFQLEATETQIWLRAEQGLYRLTLPLHAHAHWEKLSIEDGLPENELTDFCIASDTVWAIGRKGLLCFPTSIRAEHGVKPQIFINTVRAGKVELPIQRHYELAANQNNLTFEIDGVALRSQGNFHYEYRMIGIDSQWIVQSKDNAVLRYPALAPGQYQLELRSVNEEGTYSTPIHIRLDLAAPIWQRSGFIIFAILLGGALISGFYNWRIHQIKKRNEMEREKAHIEQELRSSQLSSLKAQMNPHFIFNSLNSIQEFIFLNEKRLANTFIGKFADLMRLTLDMSNAPSVSLEEELRMLRLYLSLEGLRFGELFSYEIEVDEAISASQLHFPSMLIQPYIENALKHGLLHRKDNRKLWIRFSLSEENEYLKVEVEDNGIGRAKAAEMKTKRPQKSHKSFAMGATQRRLELLNYGRQATITVKIEDLYHENEARGTRVLLWIPLQTTATSI